MPPTHHYSTISQSDDPDIEPGQEQEQTRSQSGDVLWWLKVTTTTLVVIIIALLAIISISPPAPYETRSTTKPVGQNLTVQEISSAVPFAFQKRDDWWDKKVKKGHWLVCLMNMKVEDVKPQSPWSEFAALQQNGWDLQQWTLDQPGNVSLKYRQAPCL